MKNISFNIKKILKKEIIFFDTFLFYIKFKRSFLIWWILLLGLPFVCVFFNIVKKKGVECCYLQLVFLFNLILRNWFEESTSTAKFRWASHIWVIMRIVVWIRIKITWDIFVVVRSMFSSLNWRWNICIRGIRWWETLFLFFPTFSRRITVSRWLSFKIWFGIVTCRTCRRWACFFIWSMFVTISSRSSNTLDCFLGPFCLTWSVSLA